jgi:hypothetical protein
MKIQHFYHIYCENNYCKTIVENHFNLLHKTKLYDSFNSIYIGLCGSNTESFKSLLKKHDPAKKIKIINEQVIGWEQVTLSYLEKSKDKFVDDIIFYAHTKGSSKTDKWELSKAYLWRKNMEYYNIKKWKDALFFLEKFDAYGIHYRNSKNKYYAGNYWWTKGSLILKTEKLLFQNRFDAEHWIGTAERVLFYDACPEYPIVINFKGVHILHRIYTLLFSVPLSIIIKKIKKEFIIKRTYSKKRKINF